MTRALRPAARGALLVVAVVACAGGTQAQEISGTAVDAEGRPLADVPVALHRIGPAGGATVDAAATDARGRFRFDTRPGDSAVHFVAMRHQDRLYIGPPARPGAEPVTDYVVRADPAAEAGAVASALSAATPVPRAAPPAAPGASAGAAALLVALLALAVGAVILTTAPGYRRRRQRDALIELAGIENRLANASAAGEDAAARRRRDVLRERLAPRG